MRRPRQHQRHTAAAFIIRCNLQDHLVRLRQQSGPQKMASERQEQVERRLAQSRRLINEASDPLTKERIARFIGDLEQEQQLEDEK
jgi:hypothetical protein